jgi:parallel beta-helix repeat protein
MNHMKKLLVVGVILLFLGSSIPVLAHSNENNLPSSRGNWLYVGGTGPGNYTTIQDAANHASEGDTVYVYDDSSPYYEQVTISTTISLLGEDQESTVICGQSTGSTITIRASGVTLANLSIEKGASSILLQHSNDSCIQFCTITNCTEGITLSFASNNIIHNTIITNCSNGIALYSSSSQNTIYDNILTRCKDYDSELGSGVLISSSKNSIYYNQVYESDVGILIGLWKAGNNNTVKRNTITNCTEGINLDTANLNLITQNNIINTRGMAIFTWSNLNCWLNNYWGRPLSHPKVIIGFLCPRFLDGTYIKITIPWINIDWIPAKQPFDTRTMN